MSKLSSGLSTGQIYYRRHKEKIKRLKAEWQKRNPEKVRIYQRRWREKKMAQNRWFGRREEIPFDALGIDHFIPKEEIGTYPESICGYYSPDNERWQRACGYEFFVPLNIWTIDS